MASSNREASPAKANEGKVNVESLNKPKQATVDESKKQTHQELRKLEHAPELSRTAVHERELATDQPALSTSDDHLLVYDTTKFVLFDKQLQPVKELEWKEFDSSGVLTVDDLAYLSCANSFLVLTRSHIYELNVDAFELKPLKEFSRKDKSGEDKIEFASITAHGEHIFVAHSDAAAVGKWTWTPTLQLVNRWTKAKFVEETDKQVLAIRTDGTHVGLLIKGESTRLEVFDFNLATRIVHHLELSASSIMLTALANNQWLVADSEQRELLLINEDNQIEKAQSKDSSPLNAGRLGDDQLAVKCQKPTKLQIFKLN